MPSQLHEALLLLFCNRPALAPELLHESLGVELPHHTEVRLDSADLSEITGVRQLGGQQPSAHKLPTAGVP